MKHQVALALFVVAFMAVPTGTAAVEQEQDPGQTVRAAIPQARPTSGQAVRPTDPTQERPSAAQPIRASDVSDVANIRVEVTISYQMGTAAPVKRSGILVVADQSSGLLRLGNQVAVPSTTFQPVAAGGSATNPMTSFNYRSVGLNLDVRNVYVVGNKAKMNLNVEFSTLDDKATGASTQFPAFPTFSQGLTLVLESGKPVVVAQSSDFVDNIERKQSVEVKATILR